MERGLQLLFTIKNFVALPNIHLESTQTLLWSVRDQWKVHRDIQLQLGLCTRVWGGFLSKHRSEREPGTTDATEVTQRKWFILLVIRYHEQRPLKAASWLWCASLEACCRQSDALHGDISPGKSQNCFALESPRSPDVLLQNSVTTCQSHLWRFTTWTACEGVYVLPACCLH